MHCIVRYMTETFYRFHWADCPTFSAENAWSAQWGAQRTPDGMQIVCVACDGTGEGTRDCPRCNGPHNDYEDRFSCTRCDGTGDVNECLSCEGEGTIDCERGYSCETSPEALVRYFNDLARSGLADDDAGKVIIFEGDHYDTGLDGEPTAVPTRILETLTWAEFTARVNA